MLTGPLILVGQVFGAAFAAGLNLYLTVAVIGLTSRLGLIPSLPPSMLGLENGFVIASAVALYLVEFVVDKIPYVDSVWDALHTFIRPVATALLAFFALAAQPLEIQVGAAVFAFAVALAAHGTKAGLRIIINTNTAPSRWKNSLISTVEDVCAAALAVAAIRYPLAALISAGTALALLGIAGPRLWRAGVLAIRAFRAWLRGFFGKRGWRGPDALPADMKALVQEPPLGTAQPLAARAAFKGLRGVSAYRNGWIVLSNEGPRFLYRSFLSARSLAMPPISEPRVHRGLWTNTIEFQANGRACTLFLLKDGPTPDSALTDITRSHS